MKLINRLAAYLEYRGITAYAFSEQCGVSKSYLSQQLKGSGTVGSDILEKIKINYPELNLLWLVTGKGKMLIDLGYATTDSINNELDEEQAYYLTAKDELIQVLKIQIRQLESALNDKQKLIALLEAQLQRASTI